MFPNKFLEYAFNKMEKFNIFLQKCPLEKFFVHISTVKCDLINLITHIIQFSFICN